MEKEFIPYDLAFRMKAIGYDEVCFGYYNVTWSKQNELLFPQYSGEVENWNEMTHLCSAPLYQQAFRWFRERDFHTTIESYHCLGNDRPFGLGIDQKINGIWDYVDYSGDGNFDTYEEAQIKAIESILEIMEKKI